MAIGSFSMKDALSPFATEVRDGYGDVSEKLSVLIDEQRETNRLLRGLVDLQSYPANNTAGKRQAVREILGQPEPDTSVQVIP